MVDINLLPEELRKKEEKEKETAQKKPHVFEVKITPTASEGKAMKKQEGVFASLFPKPSDGSSQKSSAPQKSQFFRDQKGANAPTAVGGQAHKQQSTKPQPLDFENIHIKPEVEKKPNVAPIKKEAPKVEKKEIPKKLPVKILPLPEIYPMSVKKRRRNFWEFLKSLFHFPKRQKFPKLQVADIKVLKEVPKKIVAAPMAQKTAPVKIKAQARPPLFPPHEGGKMRVSEPLRAPLPSPSAFTPLGGQIKEMPKIQPASQEFQRGEPKEAPKSAELKEKKKKTEGHFKFQDVERPVRTLEINLIPEELSHASAGARISKKVIAMILSAVGSALLIALVFGGMKFYEDQIGTAVKTYDESIKEKKLKITEYDNERQAVDVLQSKLDLLDGLLSNHIYWTQVFGKLEQYTVEDVYFADFASSKEGSLLLSAVGKDYTSVARQIVAFQEAKDFVELVQINSASVAESEEINGKKKITKTSFSVKINLIPDIFFMKFDQTKQ